MGEQGFGFHLPPGFHSPDAALLHKARYLEGKQQQMEYSMQPSDFIFQNGESVDSSGNDQKMGSYSPSPEISSVTAATQPPQYPTPRSNEQSGKRSTSVRAVRYAFKTKCESDKLEDGYKWRKYGRKLVKKNPNPRNYYKCSNSNCNVKKRVERDALDKGIVITTYEGKHNHECPSVVYYVGKPTVVVAQQNRASSLEQYYPQIMFMSGT